MRADCRAARATDYDMTRHAEKSSGSGEGGLEAAREKT
jgi:hypothetical protein